MSSLRPERVQEALRQEISKIVQFELKDPRLGFVTITRVELTKDLRYAKVFFSVLGDSKDKKNTLKGLNAAKGYIKGKIPDGVSLRFMPEIAFKIDESLEHAKHIYELLDKLKKERRDEADLKGDKET